MSYCAKLKGTQFQNLTLKCCFLTWRRACHSYSGYMYRAAQLITTGKYFPFLKGTYSLDFACSFFCFCFCFYLEFAPVAAGPDKDAAQPSSSLVGPLLCTQQMEKSADRCHNQCVYVVCTIHCTRQSSLVMNTIFL